MSVQSVGRATGADPPGSEAVGSGVGVPEGVLDGSAVLVDVGPVDAEPDADGSGVAPPGPVVQPVARARTRPMVAPVVIAVCLMVVPL
jgi:hypothetical protein